MSVVLDTGALLTLWERALGQPSTDRDAALLQAWDGAPHAHAQAHDADTLGARNVRLLDMHAHLFGASLELLSHCPACGTAVAFDADCASLTSGMQRTPQGDAPSHRIEADGVAVEFRLPAAADIAAAAASASASSSASASASRRGATGAPDDEEFARRLLERCVLTCVRQGTPVDVHELPAPILDALSRAMESLDPGASVSFALACPQCLHAWESRLDVGDVVWQKVRAAAERLLLDVDVLARAYGWTEREVLRLHPVRRAAYLQLVTA
ncbi:MAG: hypothetical protein ABI652_04105 [Acidobacteriota bacterium]